MSYYNNAGEHQTTYNRLADAMPVSGNCPTVAGELTRAASRLAHDFYNNGMGNNTSGALHFLAERGVFPRHDRDTDFTTVYDYTRGRIYRGNYKGDSLHNAIESVVNRTMAFIIANPALETTPNTDDMFDFEEPMINVCDECEDEIEYSMCGYLCNYCEEQYEEEEESVW